jgi:hypothetical protein
MKLRTLKTSLLVATAVALLSAQSSQAGIIFADLADETLVGLNGLVEIGEFGSSTTGYYRVDVASGVALTGFAVSTEAPDASTPRAGWSASNLSSAEWDALFGAGNFLSFFGSSESRVNYYFLSGVGADIDDGNDQDQVVPGLWSEFDSPEFFFGFAAASEFVAFGKSGAVVDYSLARSSVPDASSTLALLSPALIGLAWLRRKVS